MALTTLATLQAGEIDKVLSFTQSTAGPNMTSAVITLLVTGPYGTNTYTCTLASDNKTPQYTTNGTEFPVNGTYQVQLQYTNPNNGATYFSPIGQIVVNANL